MNSYERRVRAFSIDISMATILFIILAFVASTIEQWTGQTKLLACASLAYFGVLLIPNFFAPGQSFGKRTQKMRVVNVKTGKVPNLFLLILRELFKGILLVWTYGLYLMICGIMLSSRKDGRTIHDLIFGTQVVCLTRYLTDKEGSMLDPSIGSARDNLKGSSYHD